MENVSGTPLSFRDTLAALLLVVLPRIKIFLNNLLKLPRLRLMCLALTGQEC